MLHQIMSIYDSKVDAFLPPFYAQTKGQALRMFQDAVNQDGHTFNKHAADYTLFHIGSFDDETGWVEALMAFDNYGTGLQLQQALTRDINNGQES